MMIARQLSLRNRRLVPRVGHAVVGVPARSALCHSLYWSGVIQLYRPMLPAGQVVQKLVMG